MAWTTCKADYPFFLFSVSLFSLIFLFCLYIPFVSRQQEPSVKDDSCGKRLLCLTEGVTIRPPGLELASCHRESGCHVPLSPLCLQALVTASHSSLLSPSLPSTFLDDEPWSPPLLLPGNVSPSLLLLLVGLLFDSFIHLLNLRSGNGVQLESISTIIG